ncbi:Endonuclease/exonuclease/phosphatase domain-containing protein 1 [Cichlidogyrus casuarinus]|uniref:Endonuclease/exonuclease/phosphatase domain-containing protein 1 n=1 Tax=Cichlidogyrus casuarinus TaxID=1844966 RepID=A0ABD2QK48_9PLAT
MADMNERLKSLHFKCYRFKKETDQLRETLYNYNLRTQSANVTVETERCHSSSVLQNHNAENLPEVGISPTCSVSNTPNTNLEKAITALALEMANTENPGFLEAICLTILWSKVDLLALQELGSPEAAHIIVAELNCPQLHHVKKMNGMLIDCQKWMMVVLDEPAGKMYKGQEYSALIYNNRLSIDIKKFAYFKTNKTNPSRAFTRSPLLIELGIGKVNFLIVSLHLKFPGLQNEHVARTTDEVHAITLFMQAFYESHQSQTYPILIGDFNMNQSHPSFDGLKKLGMSPVFEEDEITTTSHVKFKDKGKPSINTDIVIGAYDNIWLPYFFLTGAKGIVWETLRHPFIPHDKGWNGFVSDHCLIWCDIDLQSKQ